MPDEFQYNICTCGADFKNISLHLVRRFQYNICTCGALVKKLDSVKKLRFQYNICTCGASHSLVVKEFNINFNTTFVHVELSYFWEHWWAICISIQHLYMWSMKGQNMCDTKYLYFNTTFVHVEPKTPTPPDSPNGISIQHLYMWSIMLVAY